MSFAYKNTSVLYIRKKFFNQGKKLHFNKNSKKSLDSKGVGGSKPFKKENLATKNKCFYCQKSGYYIRDW